MSKRFLFSTAALLLMIGNSTYAGLIKDQVFASDGDKRTYDIYVPDHTSNTPRPLVLLLHGHGGDADGITGENNRRSPYKAWFNIAEREGLFLIIPDGEYGSDDNRGWNDCRQNAQTNPHTDDVKFLNALVETIAKQHPIDEKRIYANGTSNGGNMVYRLAQESGETYRAVAAIVASMPEHNQCSDAKVPISVLIMNGTDDPILPYTGGGVGRRKSDKEERGSVLSTRDSLEYWLRHNGILSAPSEKDYPDLNSRDKSTVHVKQYVNGENDTEVILYEIRGGGHTEPSLSEHYRRMYTALVGRQNKDIEMADEVWKFFERNR